MPLFLILLTDEKFLNLKISKIDQLIHFLLININNSIIVDMVKGILNILPNKINNEKYYKTIAKYLDNKNIVRVDELK